MIAGSLNRLPAVKPATIAAVVRARNDLRRTADAAFLGSGIDIGSLLPVTGITVFGTAFDAGDPSEADRGIAVTIKA